LWQDSNEPRCTVRQQGQKTFYKRRVYTLFTCTDSWKQAFPAECAGHTHIQIECGPSDQLSKRLRGDLRTRFDLVTLDTEGHDYHVLHSIVNAGITRFYILFEIGHAIEDLQSALALLQGQGFDEYCVCRRAGIPRLCVGERQELDQLGSLHLQCRMAAANVEEFDREPSQVTRG